MNIMMGIKRRIDAIVLMYCLIFIVFPLLGQSTYNQLDDSGKKQGPWRKTDAEGHLIYTGQFISDLPVDTFTYFYPNGRVKAISVHVIPGFKEKTIMHHPNGKIMAQGLYVEAMKDSIWLFYDDNGLLVSEECYERGIRTGVWKTFYPNGKVAEEFFWKNDKKDGPWNQFYSDGSMKLSALYANDLRNGPFRLYFPIEKMMVNGYYEKDKREGLWEYYMEDGQLQKVRQYRGGYLISEVVYIEIEEEEQE